jgi:glucose-1-phosphate adenylyltransferase
MKVLGIILAGGKGERLYPLTKVRSKPAVPFGGKYRIVDFVISNFVNSGIFSLYILVQYLSQSLIEYLRMSWRLNGITHNQFITMVPPQMRLGEMWYRGTADAVRQNLNLINDFKPDLVVVFGADHIYRMDIRQMIDFHVKNNADVTVACLPVPLKEASRYGTVVVDAKNRVKGFDEKPKDPKGIPSTPNHCYASMGNYIFDAKLLSRILKDEFEDLPGLDFGKNILPAVYKKHRVFAYDFPSQKLPGIKSYEKPGYWQDVGTIEALWNSNMDLLGSKPKLNLANSEWPIHSGSYNSPPTKYVSSDVHDSMISDGCIIEHASIKKSILGRGVIVHDKCEIEDSIIMDGCEIKQGAKLKKVIVDRFNTIKPRETIGFKPEFDMQKYHLDSSGIVVLPRGRTTKFLDK